MRIGRVVGRVVGFMALLVAAAALVDAGSVGAQGPVDYDTDDDGLIEISYLEQLDAMRWHWGECYEDCVVSEYEVETVEKDSQGRDVQVTYTVEVVVNKRHAAAFPNAMEYMGCPGDCEGYELARSLDFKSRGSYASGSVKGEWTSGNGVAAHRRVRGGFGRQRAYHSQSVHKAGRE